ncbi:MAG: ribonuclease E/G, partial [Pseudomonadota bacterium]
FNKYQLEEQIAQMHRKRINLKSGGYIVIEPTEALVTIDVNSGGATREKNIEETAFRVNMEAAQEIARQLRLRDLGGIIIIDFIDMMNKNHKQDVEKAIKAVLRRDRAKKKVLRISALGVHELSRQRLGSSLGTGEYVECPLCAGEGKLRSPEMSAVSVFRKIKSLLIKPDVSEVHVSVPANVAEYLLNKMRAQLVELENDYGRIIVRTKEVAVDNDITITAIKSEPVEQIPADDAPLSQETVDLVGAVEEDNGLDDENKRPRKPARRRRRTKKKISAILSTPIDEPSEDDPVEKAEPAPHTLEPASEETRTSSAPPEEHPKGLEPETQENKKRSTMLRRWLPFF